VAARGVEGWNIDSALVDWCGQVGIVLGWFEPVVSEDGSCFERFRCLNVGGLLVWSFLLQLSR
jgi:hypothetical protein